VEDKPVLTLPYTSSNFVVTSENINNLLKLAKINSKRRARINAHPSNDSNVHEMIIAFLKDSYVPPHRHQNKTESFHVIKGELDVVFFNEKGEINNRIELSDYSSGAPFYFRSNNKNWHTVIIKSDYAIIHETTKGPFNPSQTEYASWAPTYNDSKEVKIFMNSLV
jgi:cupin fold WbuC family metalloprotein